MKQERDALQLQLSSTQTRYEEEANNSNTIQVDFKAECNEVKEERDTLHLKFIDTLTRYRSVLKRSAKRN